MMGRDITQTGPDLNVNEIVAELIIKNQDRFINLVADVVTKARLRTDYYAAFDRYLKNAVNKYSKVKTMLYRNEPQFLYNFFVCTDLMKRGLRLNCADVNTLMTDSHYCVIRGTGGAGKSILMRHFFMSALHGKQTIPIFVELRNFEEGQRLDSYIFQTISGLGFHMEFKYFLYVLNAGNYLLLLDGYDEISQLAKNFFFKELERLVDSYPDNYYVVSSRPDDCFIGWQRFTTYETTPLNLTQAVELVNKLDYDAELKEKFIGQLQKSLYSEHMSFASNPLLLNIMLLTFDNYSEIPQKKYLFYAQAYDTMYSMHDATKGGYHRKLQSSLPSDKFKNLFSEFCFRSYLLDKTEFSPDEMMECLEEMRRETFYFDIENFKYDLTVSVCLMYIEGRNYLFSHRSFQEYFSALFIKNMTDKDQCEICRTLIEEYGSRIKTDGVFDMLSDMIPQRFEQNVVISFLEKIERLMISVGDTLKMYFLAIVKEVKFVDFNHLMKDEEVELIFRIKGYEKTNNFMVVNLCENINPEMFLFVGRKYNMIQSPDKNVKKLDVKYLQQTFSANDVTREPILFEYICNCDFGVLLKSFVGLKERLKQNNIDAHKMIKKLIKRGKNREC